MSSDNQPLTNLETWSKGRYAWAGQCDHLMSPLCQSNSIPCIPVATLSPLNWFGCGKWMFWHSDWITAQITHFLKCIYMWLGIVCELKFPLRFQLWICMSKWIWPLIQCLQRPTVREDIELFVCVWDMLFKPWLVSPD